MEPTPLSPEDRQRILDEIHQREFLERQALAEEKKAREVEAERAHHESLVADRTHRENQRREYIRKLLEQSFDELGRAIAAFEEGDESEAYRLMVKFSANSGLAQQRLIRPLDTTPLVGVLPTVKIKASNPLGFALVNTTDFIEGFHELYEESASEH